MMEKTYMVPNPVTPNQAIFIDEEKCTGCNACANICRTQTIMINPEKGGVPVILYPDECWFCACCTDACKTGALQMNFPINLRSFWKRKDTGEIVRLGQKNPPEQTYFEKPIG